MRIHLRRFLLFLPILLIILTGGLAVWLFVDLPSSDLYAAHLPEPSIRITDRTGRLLYESLPETGGRHRMLPVDQMPLLLQEATIATEDANFYRNPGIDLEGIVRAFWINLRGGETLSGGSTITQQVARNLLLSENERAERTLRRKLRESLLAWQITQRYDKDEILALYLNGSYYGGLAYGVEAAAQTYFGRPASQLDLAESALLAGLPQAPALYNPFSDPDAARQRRSVVLGLMEKAGYIDAEQRTLAEREPINLAVVPYPLEAPHFALMVRAQVDALFTQEQLFQSGGVVVRTTLDLDAQHAAETAIEQQFQRLHEKEQQQGKHYNVNNAALVALDPQTGAILAMVGSPDYNDQAHAGAINMALMARQPGSALKPFIYAAAFDPTRPHPWTPATALLDVTTHFVTHDGEAYTPKDYDGLEHGPVLARQALASSLNIPAVLTLQAVGLPAFFEMSTKVGLTAFSGAHTDDLEHYDLSVALGGGEVRLSELTAAYGAFATGGYRVGPFSILDITDAQGQLRYQHQQDLPVRVIDEGVAWLISDILSDDNARQIGFPPNSVLNLDRPAAVKTGTTTNFHDNWTVGYTPDLVVGVWVGNATHEAMREVNGLTGAAPIWHQTMRALLTNHSAKPFVQPSGLEQVEVCSLSGLLPTPACPYRRKEWFIRGTAPTQPDSYYQTVTIDAIDGRLAGPDTPLERQKQVLAVNLPPAVQPWARKHGLLLINDLMAGMAASSEGDSAGAAAQTADVSGLALVSPASHTVYRLNPGLPEDSQRIPIEAVGPNQLSQVTIWIDNALLASFDQPPYRVFWQLAPGEHILRAEAKTNQGETIISEPVQIEVTDESQ